MLVACPGCKSTLNLRDDLIGKTIRCGKCAMVLRIPVATPAPIAEPPVQPPTAPSAPQAIRSSTAPIDFGPSRVNAPVKENEEVFVPLLVDDAEPPIQERRERQRQRKEEVAESIPYDEFGRIAWPKVPGAAVFAGVLWSVVGVVCFARIVFPMMALASAPNRVPSGFFVFACIGILVSVLFGAMFLYCGVTTNRGTARGTLGNGIGSLVFGAFHLFQLVFVYLRSTQPLDQVLVRDAIAIALHSFFAAALILAGIFALMRITAYREMRYQREKIEYALKQLERNDWRERRD